MNKKIKNILIMAMVIVFTLVMTFCTSSISIMILINCTYNNYGACIMLSLVLIAGGVLCVFFVAQKAISYIRKDNSGGNE